MTNKKHSGRRIFSYDEALSTFPLVRDLTDAAVRQIDVLTEKFGHPRDKDFRRGEFDEACDRVIRAWAHEISSIGCEVKGVFLVDWDSGDGYYCWRFPEQAISFFHTYEEGFEGRIPIN
jgi:hypothetical protein